MLINGRNMSYRFNFGIYSTSCLALMFAVGTIFVLIGWVPKLLGNESIFNLGVLLMLLAVIFYCIIKH
jgi:hypothetical protein